MPEILVVQLKRFDYTKYSRDKREDLVSFPITGLDLGVHLKVPGAPGAQGTVYDLYAVSNHFGGMGGGHYTAYAKNPVNKHWYNFNDSYVERVDDESQIQTAAAYMLFYQRRAT
jgi:ubiquitin C-terminal hydrolase